MAGRIFCLPLDRPFFFQLPSLGFQRPDPDQGFCYDTEGYAIECSDPDELKWQEACDYCERLHYAGHQDWCLPSRRELTSLSDTLKISTDPFLDCREAYYWSASTYTYHPINAWGVNIGLEQENFYNRDNYSYVLCVRGGSQKIANISIAHFWPTRPPASKKGPAGTSIQPLPTFSWHKTDEEVWYQLGISGDYGKILSQCFPVEEIIHPRSGTCAVTSDRGFPPSAYTWWVRAWNLVGYGTWSRGMEFRVSDDLPGNRKFQIMIDNPKQTAVH